MACARRLLIGEAGEKGCVLLVASSAIVCAQPAASAAAATAIGGVRREMGPLGRPRQQTRQRCVIVESYLVALPIDAVIIPAIGVVRLRGIPMCTPQQAQLKASSKQDKGVGWHLGYLPRPLTHHKAPTGWRTRFPHEGSERLVRAERKGVGHVARNEQGAVRLESGGCAPCVQTGTAT